MQQIALFLESFKSIGMSNILLKEAVIESVFQHTSIKLQKADVEIKNENIYIKLPPGGKSELFMKRDAIANNIASKMGKKTAPKVR